MMLQFKRNRRKSGLRNSGSGNSTPHKTKDTTQEEIDRVRRYMQSVDPCPRRDQVPFTPTPFSIAVSNGTSQTASASAPLESSNSPVQYSFPPLLPSLSSFLDNPKHESCSAERAMVAAGTTRSISKASSTACSDTFNTHNKLTLPSTRLPSPRKNFFGSTNNTGMRKVHRSTVIKTSNAAQHRHYDENFDTDRRKSLPHFRSSEKSEPSSTKRHAITIDGESGRRTRYMFDDLPPSPSGGLYEADPTEMGSRTRSNSHHVALFSTHSKNITFLEKNVEGIKDKAMVDITSEEIIPSTKRARHCPSRSQSRTASDPFMRNVQMTPRCIDHSNLSLSEVHSPLPTLKSHGLKSRFALSKTPKSESSTFWTTPKRVSLEHGTFHEHYGKEESRRDFTTQEKLVSSPPKLLFQPSASTTMAASALISLMAKTESPPFVPRKYPPSPKNQHLRTPQQGPMIAIERQCLNRRSLQLCATHDAPARPERQTRLIAPRRISDFQEDQFSYPFVRTPQECPNTKGSSHVLSHEPRIHSILQKRKKVRKRKKDVKEGKTCHKNDSNHFGSTLLNKKKKEKKKLCTLRPPADSSTSDPSICSFKRIPRRFMEDSTLPILKDGMRLAAPEDEDNLNSLHCFVRSNLLEVFVLEDSEANGKHSRLSRDTNETGLLLPRSQFSTGSSSNIHQRVGIRCVYCGKKNQSFRTPLSTFFPKSLEDIYRGVCTWQRIHFKNCDHVPRHMKDLYRHHKASDRTRGKKAYWVTSAYAMGLRNVDGHRNGVVLGKTTEKKNERIFPKTQSSSPGIVTLDLTVESPLRE